MTWSAKAQEKAVATPGWWSCCTWNPRLVPPSIDTQLTARIQQSASPESVFSSHLLWETKLSISESNRNEVEVRLPLTDEVYAKQKLCCTMHMEPEEPVLNINSEEAPSRLWHKPEGGTEGQRRFSPPGWIAILDEDQPQGCLVGVRTQHTQSQEGLIEKALGRSISFSVNKMHPISNHWVGQNCTVWLFFFFFRENATEQNSLKKNSKKQ